jgi:hypothetical protein
VRAMVATFIENDDLTKRSNGAAMLDRRKHSFRTIADFLKGNVELRAVKFIPLLRMLFQRRKQWSLNWNCMKG